MSFKLKVKLKLQIKSKTVRKGKKGHSLYRLFCPKRIFLRSLFYLNVQSTEYNFRIYILLHIKNTLLHTFLLLVFKIVESLQCTLKSKNVLTFFITLI